MNHTLQYTKHKAGPIEVRLAPVPFEEIVERRHGVFKITMDDAGRWLLFERRSILGKTVYCSEWNKVLTVERERSNPMFYSITFADTNERTVRQAQFAKQVIVDILDWQEREFNMTLNGF